MKRSIKDVQDYLRLKSNNYHLVGTFNGRRIRKSLYTADKNRAIDAGREYLSRNGILVESDRTSLIHINDLKQYEYCPYQYSKREEIKPDPNQELMEYLLSFYWMSKSEENNITVEDFRRNITTLERQNGFTVSETAKQHSINIHRSINRNVFIGNRDKVVDISNTLEVLNVLVPVNVRVKRDNEKWVYIHYFYSPYQPHPIQIENDLTVRLLRYYLQKYHKNSTLYVLWNDQIFKPNLQTSSNQLPAHLSNLRKSIDSYLIWKRTGSWCISCPLRSICHNK